ncbi:MAG: RNA polymerase factor sigma-32 [Zetaproteobacteria bacterium]|nr:RNA polymerase factor sigma-32 [Zetaproteobacteria bacterium]
MNKLPSIHKPRSIENVSPLQLYLQEIAKYPLLEPEEELELAKKHFEEEDTRAAHRLVTSNLRLVVKIANDFRKSQVNLLDLIQEGNFGLMQAVKKYNPYKGVKLSSYAAWWIRAYILKYLLDNRSQVKIATTAAQRKLFYNLQKETDRLLLEHDTVDPKQIAENLDVSERDVLEMQRRLALPDVPMDAPVSSEEGGATHGELIADTSQGPIDELLATEEIRHLFHQHVKEFKATLRGRELDVFELRLMAEKPETLQALGDKYGISRERARQIENKILKKLKKFVDDRGVLDIS